MPGRHKGQKWKVSGCPRQRAGGASSHTYLAARQRAGGATSHMNLAARQRAGGATSHAIRAARQQVSMVGKNGRHDAEGPARAQQDSGKLGTRSYAEALINGKPKENEEKDTKYCPESRQTGREGGERSGL